MSFGGDGNGNGIALAAECRLEEEEEGPRQPRATKTAGSPGLNL
jgi:hypothetical protein